MNFTNDEMNLMCIYNTGSRESLMRELREMRGYIGAEDQRRGICGAGAVPGFLRTNCFVF